jgi:dTDP-4-dehydrorhamnose reductase
MRVLVLGGAGMLGHKVVQALTQQDVETWCTVRETGPGPLDEFGIAAPSRIVRGVDAMCIDEVERLVREMRPEAVVNCVGVIKQRDEATSAVPSITINSLLPHRLAATLAPIEGHLIHFSTDCVFSGRRGDYREDDLADAEDLYGRTKLLGEVEAENALTLRTSIIGRELRYHRSLLDWFLSQEGGTVRGFTNAWWSGVTTLHLAALVADVLVRHPTLSGLYQVAGRKISKHDLLVEAREALGVAVEIVPDDGFQIDRSLSGDRLRDAIGYEPPEWRVLLAELAADPTPYPQLAGAA